MVTSDTLCATLDHGGGVRFGPHTFAIYSCAPLPASFAQHQLNLGANIAFRNALNTAAAQVCETLPVYVDLDASQTAQLTSLPVPAQPPINPIYYLPWFLINSARLEKHCVVGRGSVVESLLVILQRPWCVLEICCTDIETITAVREFAVLAAEKEPRSYDAAVRLLSHEIRARTSLSALDISEFDVPPSRCSAKELCEIYAATTLVRSYNRFWLPLICSCAVYLGIPFSEVVRRVHRDVLEGGDGTVDWIELYRVLLGLIGDEMV
ncbi:hypothetical protein BJY04DRAFT_178856 [Aspergillus karnatakaensis]|uniref:uncharacterized protein n=1 Tax=Aspergillus karnatakaensis TaxID=1810916 RepID=UPI003CCE36F7